jgi:hypothetical protein
MGDGVVGQIAVALIGDNECDFGIRLEATACSAGLLI